MLAINYIKNKGNWRLGLVDANYHIENGQTTGPCCIPQDTISFPGVSRSGRKYEKECTYVYN